MSNKDEMKKIVKSSIGTKFIKKWFVNCSTILHFIPSVCDLGLIWRAKWLSAPWKQLPWSPGTGKRLTSSVMPKLKRYVLSAAT